MDKDFWLSKWQDNDIGFHRSDIHPALLRNDRLLEPLPGQTVFVPLCGKSLDMIWWKNKGVKVVGVELSSLACEAFFQENNLSFTKQTKDQYQIYSSENITIYEGDFFLFKGEEFIFDFIYDRASVIALPEEMREAYYLVIKKCISPSTKYLMVTLEYDQSKLSGPPFSVPEVEVLSHFQQHQVDKISEVKLDLDNPKFSKAGVIPLEKVYLIQRSS